MLLRDFWPARSPLSAVGSVAVTPSDSADIVTNGVALALYVTTGGAVAFVAADGSANTITVGDKSILPLPVTRVKSTGTTATGIHAFV